MKLVGEIRDPLRLRRHLHALAVNTAGTPSTNTLLDASGISRETAVRFDELLERMFVTEQLPAWSTSHLTRVSARRKRYLCEPALVATLHGLDRRAILRSADLAGRLFETFVLAQLRPEFALGELPVQAFHLRQDGRRKIDLLLQRRDGATIAIEVKAATHASLHDARHLLWLRDSLPASEFRAGIVFKPGRFVEALTDRIWAVPICSIWGD